MMTLTQMHLVQQSPWPLLMAISLTGMTFSMTYMLQCGSLMTTLIPFLLSMTAAACWWKDIINESTTFGAHNKFVTRGLYGGFMLFILSEVMFFSSFFWMYFHSSLSPSHDIGMTWPSEHVYYLNPYAVPLLNTAILLVSGLSLTYAHSSMSMNNKNMTLSSLNITIILGVLFTYLQSMEYKDTTFDITDSVAGSALFIATGFHGVHVIVGTLFLSTISIRSFKDHFSSSHMAGFEMAAWYWHFVDVVWLYLFTCMYWWPST